MRTAVTICGVVLIAAALCASCSTKEKVVTGKQYKCKECGKVFRDDTKEMEVDKSVAKDLGVEVVEDYCPKCGGELVTIEQTQHQKCPVCGADNGTVVKKITIERRLGETVPAEVEIPVTCNTGKCARVGNLHEKYNWDWDICRAVVDQEIGYGFNKDQVREAWGTPKRVEKVGNAENWYYDAGYVTVGASGKVIAIKQ
jgi:5-methylcytosine-specific restriction endonuclease McrA